MFWIFLFSGAMVNWPFGFDGLVEFLGNGAARNCLNILCSLVFSSSHSFEGSTSHFGTSRRLLLRRMVFTIIIYELI